MNRATLILALSALASASTCMALPSVSIEVTRSDQPAGTDTSKQTGNVTLRALIDQLTEINQDTVAIVSNVKDTESAETAAINMNRIIERIDEVTKAMPTCKHPTTSKSIKRMHEALNTYSKSAQQLQIATQAVPKEAQTPTYKAAMDRYYKAMTAMGESMNPPAKPGQAQPGQEAIDTAKQQAEKATAEAQQQAEQEAAKKDAAQPANTQARPAAAQPAPAPAS